MEDSLKDFLYRTGKSNVLVFARKMSKLKDLKVFRHRARAIIKLPNSVS